MLHTTVKTGTRAQSPAKTAAYKGLEILTPVAFNLKVKQSLKNEALHAAHA